MLVREFRKAEQIFAALTTKYIRNFGDISSKAKFSSVSLKETPEERPVSLKTRRLHLCSISHFSNKKKYLHIAFFCINPVKQRF